MKTEFISTVRSSANSALFLSWGLAFGCIGAEASVVTNSFTDSGEALINPGMGLVHYHYSNRLWAYGKFCLP